MRKHLKNWRRWLPAALYLGFALAWVCAGLLDFAANRAAATVGLDPAAATAEGLLAVDSSGQNTKGQAAPEALYISENGDPKLIFEGVSTGARVRYVRLAAGFSADPGELDLFYTTKPGQGFSVRHRAVGAPQADGSWLYTLPPLTPLWDLRVDLGTVGENAIAVSALELNPHLPAGHFLAPTLRSAVWLAAAPALALCAIYTIIEWYQTARKWRVAALPRKADP